MASAAIHQDDAEDRYYTQVEAGDVRLLTLDQLDAAFNAGFIHEQTYVCLEGESQWLTLAEVAGLTDEAPVSAHYPVAAAVEPWGVPSPRGVPLSVAPVAHDLAFESEPDISSFRPKRRGGKIVGLLAIVAASWLGFTAVKGSHLRLPMLDMATAKVGAALRLTPLAKERALPPAAVAAVAALPAPLDPTPSVDVNAQRVEPTPAPNKVDQGGPSLPTPASSSGVKLQGVDTTAKKADPELSEQMSLALLNKGKKPTRSHKPKKVVRKAIATKKKVSKVSTGFKTGGSAYDPLNGKL